MRPISTKNAPAPAGHYSQGMIHGGLVFVSGQLPIDPASGQPLIGSIEEQTQLAISNVASILEKAGSSLDRVVKTTVYVSNVDLWGRVNAVYAESFGDHRPARAVVPTRDLHFGCQVEIDAVATIDD